MGPCVITLAPGQVLPRDVAAIKTHYADRPNMGNRLLSYLRMVFALAVYLLTAAPLVALLLQAQQQLA